MRLLLGTFRFVGLMVVIELMTLSFFCLAKATTVTSSISLAFGVSVTVSFSVPETVLITGSYPRKLNSSCAPSSTSMENCPAVSVITPLVPPFI